MRKPGSRVRFQGKWYRIRRMSGGDGEIEVEAVGYNSRVYDLVEHNGVAGFGGGILVVGRPLIQFIEAPLHSVDAPSHWSPRIVTRQDPWPGEVLVYREDGSGGYTLNTSLDIEAVIGETTTVFAKGAPWVWDNASTVTVRLYDPLDSLSSETDIAVLNGANAMLIETPSGEWEVFQFANATLNGDGTFTLSRMLRGQLGTEAYMGDPTPAGARVVVYDPTVFGTLGGTQSLNGVQMNLRYGPGGIATADPRYTDVTITPRGVGYRPYAPVNLVQSTSGSDIVLSWVRRTRFGGDPWDVVDVPLQEDFERYEVDILNGSTVVRTVRVDNATSLTYTAAQQVADFGSTQSSVTWVVHQISGTYGRGTPAYG